MAWTDGDFKIFAAGLAIGGKYNNTHGTLPRVKSSVQSGTYWYTQYFTLSCDMAEATIYFSILGDTAFQIYTGQELYIGDDMIVLAYAVYGQSLSPMAKFTYVVDNPFIQQETILLSTPVFNVGEIIEISLDTIVFELSESVNLTSDLIEVTNDDYSFAF